MSQQTFKQKMKEGSLLLSKGDAEQALPIIYEAYLLYPSDPDAALNLGGAYIMLNQHEQAIVILEQAAQIQPENSKIWINLAAAYLGNLVDSSDQNQLRAIDAFKKALELDPAAPSANYNLGLIHRHRGEIEDAIAHFRRAAAINPFDQDAQRIYDHLSGKTKPSMERGKYNE